MGDRLILGGEFGKINTTTVRGLAAIDPETGAIDPSFNLPISESRDAYAPYVLELDVSADGRWLVIGGNFKKVGDVDPLPGRRHRPRRAPARRSRPGRPTCYERQCASVYNDTWIRGIDISPDSK